MDNKSNANQNLTEEQRAFNKAVDSLSRGAKSAKELRVYLRDKGFCWPVCVATVDKLIGYRYVDDAAYVEAYLSHYGRKFGRYKLIYELTTAKGVDETMAKNMVYDAFTDEVETEKAKAIAETYMKKNAKKADIKKKAYAYLRGKGFDGDIIMRALNALGGDDDYAE